MTRRLKFLDRGGSTSVSLDNPRRFERITAVLVNADARVRGFAQRRLGLQQGRGPLPRQRPSASRRPAEQLLDHEHVLPLAVEAAVAAVDADVVPAAGVDERDAGGVAS